MSAVKVTIQLHRDVVSQLWYLDRVEAQRGHVKSVTSFMVPMPLNQAFAREMIEFLEPQLPVHGGLAVLSLDEYQIATLDLRFSGIRVIAQRALGGLQSVTVRIKEVAGTLSRLYPPAVHPGGELFEAVPADAAPQQLSLSK